MYLWEENTAKRGSVEIYSCLNKWINEHVLNVEQYPRNLKIFADNCGGQNKNNNMCISMLMNVHKKKFDRIEFGFLVPGHTYNSCDRVFAWIENKYNVEKDLTSPALYLDRIQQAVKKSRGFTYHMQREEFLNIEVFANRPSSGNRLAYVRPTADKLFQKARLFVMDKSYKQGYIVKQSFNQRDNNGVKVSLHLPEQNEADFDISTVELCPKYSQERKLPILEIEDLAYLKNNMSATCGKWLTELICRQKKLKNEKDENSDEQGKASHDPDSFDRIYEDAVFVRKQAL